MISNQIENIRKLRKSKKMTQKDLADLTGLTVKTISRFEGGEKISLTSEKKIFLALGFDFLKDSDHLIEKTKLSFDKQADKYNNFTLLTDRQYIKRILNVGHPFKEKKVLDLGCGTGILALELSQYAKSVYAIDISKNMIKNLKARVKKSSVKNLKVFQGDAQEIDFSKNSFDTIISVLTLHHFHDIEKVMENVHKTLKQFGEFIIVDIVSSPNEADSFIHNSCEKIRDFSHNKFYMIKELKTYLKNYGFGDFIIEKFEVERDYEQWIKMSNYEDSEKLLFNLMWGLALKKIDLGIDLRIEEDKLFFTQKMILIKATKLGNN